MSLVGGIFGYYGKMPDPSQPKTEYARLKRIRLKIEDKKRVERKKDAIKHIEAMLKDIDSQICLKLMRMS